MVAGCGSGAAHRRISLDAIILRPSQVGSGFVEHPYQDARVVAGQVTLDLCGFRFPSESLRTARFEVAYVKAGGKLAVSNEVVRYLRGGTRQAIQELNNAADRCPTRPVTGPVAGIGPTTYHVTRLAATGLQAEALALKVNSTGIADGRRVRATFYVIYQTKEDVLSAIAVVGPPGAAAERLTLHAAQQSAHNLSSAG